MVRFKVSEIVKIELMSSSTKNLDNKNILEAVNKRRNFAIISHPDAGKTTLTEKLLLYGGLYSKQGQ